MLRRIRQALLCVATLAAASVALAQNAKLSGQVVDADGAAVPNAEIQVFNKDTQVKLQTETDASGNYTVPFLPAGNYRVEAQASGFSQEVNDNVVLSANQALIYNIHLKIESVKSEVGVEAGNAAHVETETSEVAGKITQKEVVSFGLNGRNFTQLIALAPGVSNQTGQDEAKVGVVGSVKYSVNGGRVEYNTFEVDGGDVLNTGVNGAASTLIVYPSLDAIQEVKVLTSNYGAQYGRTASGTVLVTTKSGSVDLHGNAYEFIRNEAFNGRNYFDLTKSAPLYRRQDFGGTIGGPLIIPHVYNTKRDTTFFFFSEEFRLEKSPTEYNQAVPSLKERGLIQTPQGIQQNLVTGIGAGGIPAIKRSFDFTDVCPLPGSNTSGGFQRSQFPDCPSLTIPSQGTLPVTFFNNDLEQFASNTGEAVSGVDKNALALLSSNLIPLPNSPLGCSYRVINPDPTDPNHCYDATVSPSTYWREELFRIDHNFTPGIRASFRYIHDSWDTTVLTPQWGAVRDTFPTVQNRFLGPGTSLVARLTTTISPTMLNEFVATYENSTITLTDKNGPGGAQYQRNPLLDQPLVADPSARGQCNNLISIDPVSRQPQCAMGYIFNNGFGGKMPGMIFAGTNAAYGGEGFIVDPSYMPWAHSNPTYSARDDVSKSLGKHTLQLGAQAVLSQRNQTNNSIGAATGDVQGLLTYSNLANSTGNAFADFLLSPGTYIQSFTQDSSQGRYYQRYEIVEPYFNDDWRLTQHLTVNLGLRVSLFGTYSEKNHNAWNWEASRFNRSAFAVDPNTGMLLDAITKLPILINSQNQLPASEIGPLGLVQCGVNKVPAACMTGHLFNPAPRVGFAWDPTGTGKMSIRGGYGIFFEHGTGNEANTGSLEASAPVVLSMTQHFPNSYACIGGIGYGPTFDPNNTSCTRNTTLFKATPVPNAAYPINVTSIPTHAVWPYAQQWSFSVQRQLPKDFVGTVGYVGSRGTHLTVALQLNQLPPLPAAKNPFGPNEPLTVTDCAISNLNPVFFLQNGTTVGPQDPAYQYMEAACTSPIMPDVNSLPGRPYSGLGKIYSLQNIATSSYHALQATLRRTRGPLTLGASYTYSHSLDNASDRSDPILVNSYDLRANRASSSFDERHLLNFSYVYQIPMASLLRQFKQIAWAPGNEDTEHTKLAKSNSNQANLVQGWELSGITIFETGVPFTVINSAGNTGISLTDNAGVSSGLGIAASYPDIVHGLPKPRNNSQSFGPLLRDPAQFVAPRGLTFGNAGRNFLNNPSRYNFDVALLKHFQIRETREVEFRAEAFNVFNHTQFRIWDPDNPGSSGNNVVSCYAGPQYSAGFQAIGGADCVTGASFLHPIDAHRPRTLQFGLKLSF